MSGPSFDFSGVVWEHDGPSSWHFLTLPLDVAEAVRELTAGSGTAFGTVPVQAEISGTKWSTSIFVDTKRDSFLLPLKAKVRKETGISDGSEVRCRIVIDI